MITTCVIDPPPAKEEFLTADIHNKLLLVTNAWNAQTSNLKGCSFRMEQIQRWKEKLIKEKGDVQEYNHADD